MPMFEVLAYLTKFPLAPWQREGQFWYVNIISDFVATGTQTTAGNNDTH